MRAIPLAGAKTRIMIFRSPPPRLLSDVIVSTMANMRESKDGAAQARRREKPTRRTLLRQAMHPAGRRTWPKRGKLKPFGMPW